MYRIRLIKGLSYYDGKITATKKKPDVYVEDQETVKHYVATGFFMVVGVEPKAEGTDDEVEESFIGDDEEPEGQTASKALSAELESMNVKELRAYASKHGINLTASKKEDMMEQIMSAQERAAEARTALRE